MTGHTPGPWAAENCGGTGVRYAIRHHLRPRAAIRIATVFETGAAKDPNEQSHANARLIAAAPDLLAVLKQIAFDWDGEPEDMQEARELIARAEGHTPDTGEGE